MIQQILIKTQTVLNSITVHLTGVYTFSIKRYIKFYETLGVCTDFEIKVKTDCGGGGGNNPALKLKGTASFLNTFPP